MRGLFGAQEIFSFKHFAFAAILVATYWMPKPDKILYAVAITFGLVFFAIIFLSWYDYRYGCSDYPGSTRYERVVSEVDNLLLFAAIAIMFIPVVIWGY